MRLLLVHKLEPVGEDKVTFGAIPYYRMQKPMQVLNRMFPEFDYVTIDNISNVPDDFIKGFDMVLFCREIIKPDEVSERLNSIGIPFGMDIDDYWHLDKDHIIYKEYQALNMPALVAKSLSVAHFVTCTTEILADKIKHLNKNVYVIENGIDEDDASWKPDKLPSDRLRFGFTQGNTHIHDLALISDQVKKSFKDNTFYHKAQVALCFKAEHYKGRVAPSVYIGYEKMLTDDHKVLKFYPEYSRDLKLLLKPNGEDKPYKQIWFRDVNVFGTVYDEIDISVVPLRNTEFNSCKSNIKMLEAGFKNCAVMVSEVSPYTPLATEANSFLLSKKNFFEWQRYIFNNPEILNDKREQLKEDVKAYELKKLTEKRKQVYLNHK